MRACFDDVRVYYLSFAGLGAGRKCPIVRDQANPKDARRAGTVRRSYSARY
jgi:hypothetical protein